MKKNSIQYKELAVEIKSDAAGILADFSITDLSMIDIKVLYALVSYMDTFILKCLKDNKLTNKLWIKARLMEALYILIPSKSKAVQGLLIKIAALEQLITIGEKYDESTGKDN